MNWYLKCIRQYADFRGRARRKEYWMFVLFNVLFAITALLIDLLIGSASPEMGFGFVYLLYVLFAFLPGLAVGVRRLHDLDKSGWWLLISLIPLIGGIWLLVLMVSEGDQGNNRYGENPAQVPSEALA